MIAEAALAMEYSASAEDIGRTTHAHVSLLLAQGMSRSLMVFFCSRLSRKLSRRPQWQLSTNPYTSDWF